MRRKGFRGKGANDLVTDTLPARLFWTILSRHACFTEPVRHADSSKEVVSL